MGFPGEISGRVPPRKAWQPLTLANIGFGQGLLVTPMQMVRAYASFLNGGWLVDPVLVSGEHAPPRQAPRRVFSAGVAEGVVAALASVTEQGGTGGKAILDGYRVAGKTGTAQTVDPGTGRYSRSRYISSFIGFATGVDPKLVIYAALDGPKGIYYASETAAPLFRNVLSAVVNRFSMPSDPVLVRRSDGEVRDPLAAKLQDDSVHSGQAHAELPIVLQPVGAADAGGQLKNSTMPWRMPALIGLTAREALRALQGRPYQIEIDGRGVVRTQHPEAGNTVADQATIRLSLSAP
jgi:membrane peptidoglycan carboxypeptidase